MSGMTVTTALWLVFVFNAAVAVWGAVMTVVLRRRWRAMFRELVRDQDRVQAELQLAMRIRLLAVAGDDAEALWQELSASIHSRLES